MQPVNILATDPVVIPALTRTLASLDDQAGHHIPWISEAGDLWFQLLPGGGPAHWDAPAHARVRLSAWCMGLGMVGPAAAADPDFVMWALRLFRRAYRLGGGPHAVAED